MPPTSMRATSRRRTVEPSALARSTMAPNSSGDASCPQAMGRRGEFRAPTGGPSGTQFCNPDVTPQRPDCVAGHVRLELGNVAANYPFERSLRFPGIQPNSGFGDYSRLSCGGVGDRQLIAKI
jgi:hypothetical protein